MYKLVDGVEVALTQEEVDNFLAMEAEHLLLKQRQEPELYKSQRADDYHGDGITIDAMVVAIWERIIEGRPENSDALQVKRLAVKARIPKPQV